MLNNPAGPRAILAPTTCRTCHQQLLTAEIDANSGIEAWPIRITPVLLAPTQQAAAITHGRRLFKISRTRTGDLVAGQWHYRLPPRAAATLEQSRWKYAHLLGIAAEHEHDYSPPGEPIPVEAANTRIVNPRLELLATKTEQHPEYAELLRAILDPPPF